MKKSQQYWKALQKDYKPGKKYKGLGGEKIEELQKEIDDIQKEIDNLESIKEKYLTKVKSIKLKILMRKPFKINTYDLENELFSYKKEASKLQSVINDKVKAIIDRKKEIYKNLPQIIKINMKLKDENLSKRNREYYEEERRILNISIKTPEERKKIDDLTKTILKYI
jgi:chromosome segregation ATPase